MTGKLTLLIPGLLKPPQPLQNLPADEKPAFKSLNHFFSRARQSVYPVSGFYPTLFHLFDVELHEQSDHPVAAITRLADTQGHSDAWCLRCDPAYIHADMDRAVLMEHGRLGLSMDEVEQLLMIINAHVEQDGWQVEAHSVDRWYVTGTDKKAVTTTPPHSILGQDIKHDLPKGADADYWCAIMNELQMLLHGLPINAERQAQGLLPVNSLWFWGGGVLPDRAHCQFDTIFDDDMLVKGLAMLAGCECADPATAWQSIEQDKQKHSLIVLDDLLAPQLSGDLFAWLDAVKRFEQLVIDKVFGLLKQKKLTEVTLLSGDGKQFTLSARQLRLWWKRKAGFSALLEKATS